MIELNGEYVILKKEEYEKLLEETSKKSENFCSMCGRPISKHHQICWLCAEKLKEAIQNT